MAYEPLYLAYLVYFNRDRDYFECHEVLEELWLAKDKDPLYKGLLQVAVGLYHFRNHNVRGGKMMLQGAADKLQHYPGITLGIDLEKLLGEVKAYVVRLEHYAQQPFPYYDLSIDIVDPALAADVELAASGIETNHPQRRGPQRPDRARHK
jgi:predicted metal-dependent hydrolase